MSEHIKAFDCKFEELNPSESLEDAIELFKLVEETYKKLDHSHFEYVDHVYKKLETIDTIKDIFADSMDQLVQLRNQCAPKTLARYAN